jgi:putative PIN family toxin of toxin-antitoxin system
VRTALFAELQGVLARESIRRFIRSVEGQALLGSVLLKAEILPELGPVPAFTRDPKDDKFVACALAGNAQAIITLDEDLLVLGSVGVAQILTPQAFVADLRRK